MHFAIRAVTAFPAQPLRVMPQCPHPCLGKREALAIARETSKEVRINDVNFYSSCLQKGQHIELAQFGFLGLSPAKGFLLSGRSSFVGSKMSKCTYAALKDIPEAYFLRARPKQECFCTTSDTAEPRSKLA
jgi:hypothetical protein